jgi:hypothetical protein
MKRISATRLALCLILVALVALAVAPAAFAKAESLEVTCTETWAAPPGDPIVKVSGGIAHMEFFNHFMDSPIPGSDPAYYPLYVGPNDTHLFAIATLVDGVPADAIIRGTFHKTCPAGDWYGTFNGTMSMVTAAWEITFSGRGTSGEVAGMTMLGTNVNATGAGAIISCRILSPHGF